MPDSNPQGGKLPSAPSELDVIMKPFSLAEAVALAGDAHLFTKATAAEIGRRGGLKSGAVRRAKASEPFNPEAHKDEAMRELWRAAQGAGRWGELGLDKRLDALKKFLEYAVGRPTPAKPAEEEDKTPATFEVS